MIGISKNRISNYSKKCTRGLFDKFKFLSVMYDEENITDNWKDGLEDFTDNE